MANKNLRDFIEAAKQLGPDYYVEVKQPLSDYLEIATIQQKLAEENRFPVIYCPKIKGYDIPVVSNVFGSFETVALGLGFGPESLTREQVYNFLGEAVACQVEPTLIAAEDAPVQEVKLLGEDVDLGSLPIIHNSELDAGKYVSAGFMISKWPDTGVPNTGIYRHLVMGKNKLGCMINPGHDGAYIAREYAARGEMMEVALVIGHHSAVWQATLETRGPEFNMMGAYLGEPLELVGGETVDIPVPAHAEIVIEGVIDPREMSTDGPYGEWAGYYGAANKPCYVIDVSAITMRENAVYHHLDSAHREHIMSYSIEVEGSLLSRLKAQFPSISAVRFHHGHLVGGSGQLGTYISMKQRVPGEAKQAGLAAVTHNSVKNVVVVDDDIDIYNDDEVIFAISTRMVPDKDMIILPNVKGSHLDPTSYNEDRTGRGPVTTHMVIDATVPVERDWDVRIAPNEQLWEAMNLEDYV